LAVAHTAVAVEAGAGAGGDGDGPPWYGEREARPEYGETEPGRPVCRSDCYNQTLSMAYLQGVCLDIARGTLVCGTTNATLLRLLSLYKETRLRNMLVEWVLT
jgi:hypothetical protein